MKICIGGNYEKVSSGFIAVALGKIQGGSKVN
jgi:hypothetical protein